MHGQHLVEDALDLFFLLLGPLLAELFALGHICVEVYVITFIDSAGFSLFFCFIFISSVCTWKKDGVSKLRPESVSELRPFTSVRFHSLFTHTYQAILLGQQNCCFLLCCCPNWGELYSDLASDLCWLFMLFLFSDG